MNRLKYTKAKQNIPTFPVTLFVWYRYLDVVRRWYINTEYNYIQFSVELYLFMNMKCRQCFWPCIISFHSTDTCHFAEQLHHYNNNCAHIKQTRADSLLHQLSWNSRTIKSILRLWPWELCNPVNVHCLCKECVDNLFIAVGQGLFSAIFDSCLSE